jgi:transcriptional regulator with XRE-family HTH domain
MSFQITVAPSRRAAARFVVSVRRALQKAFVEEQAKTGISQADIARALDVHRSVINRELRGSKDLTLGRVAELAWALGREPFFETRKKIMAGNHIAKVTQAASALPSTMKNEQSNTEGSLAIGKIEIGVGA